ncbi:MAG: hypothetical protein H6838_04980 [Planctomycetes bacterium]|nr:hypothetical protein [Planctomycetota bacterium]
MSASLASNGAASAAPSSAQRAFASSSNRTCGQPSGCTVLPSPRRSAWAGPVNCSSARRPARTSRRCQIQPSSQCAQTS